VRVAIDVSGLSPGLTSGTAVYLYRLAEALADRRDVELRVLYNGMPGKGAELAASLEKGSAKVVCAYFRWRALPGPLFDRPYPRALRREVDAADVFHVGEFVYPDPRGGQPVVATVHDVTTKLFPAWHAWANRLLHHRRLAWVRRHAARVIIDAEATRADTAAALGLPADRLDVVPLARGTRPRQGAPVADVRARFALGGGPYVLYVGTLEPRKNLIRLVEAFRRLPRDLAPVRLVLAGAWGWHARALRTALRSVAVRDSIVVTGGVDEGSLAALYAGATVFVYPSLYEGFGLPLLEAMAAGVPVLTSAGGTCAEVAGDAALLVDPTSVEAIARGLEGLLRSGDERRRLSDLGRARERAFTWERTAASTVEVYRRAIAGAP
jgi:glycosyltransferase involved in cell wall biosynthesis